MSAFHKFRHCERSAAIQEPQAPASLDCRASLAMTGGRFLDARHGATAVEFALIAPVLFTTLFGAIEFGRLMWTQSGLHYAVEEAARCASVTPGTCGTASQIASYAASAIAELNIASSAFTASTQSCGHQVLASYNYQFIAAGLFPYTPTLTAKACFP